MRDQDTGANFALGLGCSSSARLEVQEDIEGPCYGLLRDPGVHYPDSYFDRAVVRTGAQVEMQINHWGYRIVLWNTFPVGHAYGVSAGLVGYEEGGQCWDGCAGSEDVFFIDESPVMPINTNNRISGAAPSEALGDCDWYNRCLLYTSPSPRDLSTSRMPSSA